jgi:pimeloyl-ACP methyl ester carboxylesterase
MPTLTRSEFAAKRVPIHGHDVSYRLAGDGPVVVLMHGLACSSTTWKHVMPALAESHTVLAPDLLGHGESAKPRGDYSLGAQASGVRDLMAALGLERATLVGHSLGGGVAMQLAYQFPERCERLVLVASGGLGREVHPLLRAVTLPAAEYVLPLLLTSWLRLRAETAGGVLRRVGWTPGSSLAEVWRSYTTLTTAEGQMAFVQTVRSVIDLAGQRVSAADRLYLAAEVPTLIAWGDADAVIPVSHAYAAHEAIPGSRLEVLAGAGHFLPWKDAVWFTEVLCDFLATTTPGRPSASRSATPSVAVS